MRTHIKTDTASLANSLVLLAMVAGVLNIDVFERATVSGHTEHSINYRIELVFNTEPLSKSPVLFVSEELPGNDVAEDGVLPSSSYPICFANTPFVIQGSGQVNTRPFYSSPNHARSFNIPHQNSDEDEAFVLPIDVA